MCTINIKEAIMQRHSVRTFLSKKITRTQINELIELGILAPSGSNIQSWRFIVVDDAMLINSIISISPGINGMPPCIIVLCSDKELAYRKGGIMGRDEMSVIDVSLAAENIMLAAVGMGLGSCLIKSFSDKLVAMLLNLPPNIYPEMMITLGYSANECKRPIRKSIDEVLSYNKWGA